MAFTLGDALIKLRGDQTQLDKDLASSEQKTQSWAGRVGGFLRDSFAVTVGGLVQQGIQGITGAVGGLVNGMIAGNAEFERYQTQFGVLLGGVDAAKQRLKELATFGAQTPFELPEVVRADKILQAFGLHATNIVDRFGMAGTEIRTLAGDLAAGTGAAFEEVAGYLGKFASGATGEAIARFQELGIVTRQEMAAMGVEFSKSGELVTPVDEAMTIMLKIMKDKFGGMMDAQSATFEGMMSNLADWKGSVLRTLGEPIFEVLREKLALLLTFLNGPEVMGAIESFANIIAGGIGKLLAFIEGSVVPVFKSLYEIARLLSTGDFRGGIFGLYEDDAIIIFLFTVRDAIVFVVDTYLWAKKTFDAAGGGFIGIVAALGINPETGAQIVIFYQDLKTRTLEAIDYIRDQLQLAMIWLNENGETVRQVLIAVSLGFAAFSIISTVIGWITGLIAAWTALSGAVTALGGIGAAIVAFLGGPLTIALGVVAAAVGLLYLAWQNNWGGIQQVTADAFHYLYDLFLQAQETWEQWWKDHGDVVMAYFGLAWSTIKLLTEQFVANVLTIIDLFILAAQGDWEGFGRRLREAWDETWTRIKDFLRDITPEIITLAGALITPITDFIQSVKDRIEEVGWLQVGKDILGGIWNGIVEEFNNIKGDIEAVASAIGGIFTGFFENASPSKWMARVVGAPIVQGLLKGMEEILPQSLAKAKQMAGQIGAAMKGAIDEATRQPMADQTESTPAPLIPGIPGGADAARAAATPEGTTDTTSPPLARSAPGGGPSVQINGPLMSNVSMGSRADYEEMKKLIWAELEARLDAEFEELLQAGVESLMAGDANVPGGQLSG